MHDTWLQLTDDNPFSGIMNHFPNGFPARDPFPMHNAEKNGEMVSLWSIDIERLSDNQIDLIASTIAVGCKVDKELVLAQSALYNTLSICHDYVEDFSCGSEGTERLFEMHAFMRANASYINPALIKFFLIQQYEKWINVDPIIPNVIIPEIMIVTEEFLINKK